MTTGAKSPERLTLSPGGFRRLAAASWVLLFTIVLTGAAVRLTDSGLGCEDWPTCDEGTIIEAWTYHRSIEFGNRLVTMVVGIVCLATLVAAYRRRPRRGDLIGWSWVVVAGVGVQAIIGRFSVTTHLHPLVVAAHFLGSPLLLWASLVLWHRSGRGEGSGQPQASRALITRGRLVVALAGVVMALGTLVTGTGPNGGDREAVRLGFNLASIARVHSVSVWILLAAAVLFALRLARSEHDQAFRWARWLLAALLAQGAGGYLQYALGVPPGLVLFHIFGAITVWTLALHTYFQLWRWPPPEGALIG